MSLEDFLANGQKQIECVLQSYLQAMSCESSRLNEAMTYVCLNGGKRLRPCLVYACGQLFDSKPSTLDTLAAAIEFIHIYSLVHDDLPAMDDDALRRGQPTCHVRFDEATAILVGDALQALAFEILSEPLSDVSAEVQVKLINQLSQSAGAVGMVGGQSLDLTAVGKQLSLDALEKMHQFKTGALIAASVLLPAMAYQCSAEVYDSLKRYAACIGLAFQVQDDILDIESSTEVLGKQQGSDISKDKPTYPSLLGLDNAKQKAKLLAEEAIESLAIFEGRASTLSGIAEFIISRRY